MLIFLLEQAPLENEDEQFRKQVERLRDQGGENWLTYLNEIHVHPTEEVRIESLKIVEKFIFCNFLSTLIVSDTQVTKDAHALTTMSPSTALMIITTPEIEKISKFAVHMFIFQHCKI